MLRMFVNLVLVLNRKCLFNITFKIKAARTKEFGLVLIMVRVLIMEHVYARLVLQDPHALLVSNFYFFYYILF